METSTPLDESGADAIADFSQAHSEIISHLMAFSGLPIALQSSTTLDAARKLAAESLAFFHETIYAHHVEEEQLLFPEVLSRAARSAEYRQIAAAIEQLTREHRQVEAIWSGLEPALKLISEGKSLDIDSEAVHTLVLDYGAHAAFEEAEFLPLCREILRRDLAEGQFATTLNGQLDKIHPA